MVQACEFMNNSTVLWQGETPTCQALKAFQALGELCVSVLMLYGAIQGLCMCTMHHPRVVLAAIVAASELLPQKPNEWVARPKPAQHHMWYCHMLP